MNSSFEMMKGAYKNNAFTTDLHTQLIKTVNVNILRTTDIEVFQLKYKTS
ncbi:hypothetical protein LVDJXP189_2130005 [Flavobacterium psychrophilum]|nr:hypothetical protein [Flavobacterium psychrophilum]SNB43006.1 hypothetical protein LVDJXP189_2130005 [Flavobacterium psychrophilum]